MSAVRTVSPRIGILQTAVEAELGKPENKQQFENKIPGIDSTPQSSSCIYYHEKGQGLTVSSLQLCFDNGKLSSRTRTDSGGGPPDPAHGSAIGYRRLSSQGKARTAADITQAVRAAGRGALIRRA